MSMTYGRIVRARRGHTDSVTWPSSKHGAFEIVAEIRVLRGSSWGAPKVSVRVSRWPSLDPIEPNRFVGKLDAAQEWLGKEHGVRL